MSYQVILDNSKMIFILKNKDIEKFIKKLNEKGIKLKVEKVIPCG